MMIGPTRLHPEIIVENEYVVKIQNLLPGNQFENVDAVSLHANDSNSVSCLVLSRFFCLVSS